MFGTLQDRLIKEMRLEGISDIEAAQSYVPRFIAIWNARFAVEPRDPADAHKPWSQNAEALDQALARQEERVLSKALTFSTSGMLYCVKTKDAGIALRGAKVTLRHCLDGTLTVTYKTRNLEVTAVRSLPRPSQAEDEKTIDTRLSAVIVANIKAQKPAPRQAPGYG